MRSRRSGLEYKTKGSRSVSVLVNVEVIVRVSSVVDVETYVITAVRVWVWRLVEVDVVVTAGAGRNCQSAYDRPELDAKLGWFGRGLENISAHERLECLDPLLQNITRDSAYL